MLYCLMALKLITKILQIHTLDRKLPKHCINHFRYLHLKNPNRLPKLEQLQDPAKNWHYRSGNYHFRATNHQFWKCLNVLFSLHCFGVQSCSTSKRSERISQSWRTASSTSTTQRAAWRLSRSSRKRSNSTTSTGPTWSEASTGWVSAPAKNTSTPTT